MYIKHPWDKYGSPTFNTDNEEKDLEELENERQEILDEIDRVEGEIEDLETELDGLRSELSEIIVRIGSNAKSA